ncbi:MAG: formate dehydrogenase subunit gamma [Paracoccaceae bacterium]|jgi:formate dehydrogenase subunit gamma
MTSAALTSAEAERIDRILSDHAGLEGPLLPILHAVQADFAHVPPAALPRIAEALNISRAEIHGVVTFYHDFTDAPGGRHSLKICRAEACQAMGADRIAAHAQARIGAGWGGTDPRGAVTLAPVYCLGLCACGPAAMLDGRPVGRVDEARIDALLAECGA